jgi:nucleotide-binding universal stress UspA family protein
MLKTRRSFSKILVAIDGSEASLDAANYAIDVAKKYNAHLNALTVIDSSKPRYLTASFIAAPTYGLRELEELKQSAQKWLDKVSALAVENNIRLTSQIVEDSVSPANSIVNYAENEHIDLIVVGTRGRSGFKRLLLGSVASKVVTYASCPVIVVK